MPQMVTFTNPANGQTYVWPNNPNPDAITQPAQKQRQIDRTSNTGNVGATKQQGDDGPYIIHWEPLVFTAAHEQALWTWWQLCKSQTIYLTDFNGEEFEGQIITLGRQQIGALGGPGDTNERLFYVKYVFEFEVYRFVSGLMAAAGVTP
jgi:hypothetical protein